ncbi:4'-phosphopantetheinyl transferase superfamily protein [Candidatus Dependentiae bacterium]|nr:4'-phosphopantetheinyl transferase superfamily protein [Candidatus Dependentiae bacterium]
MIVGIGIDTTEINRFIAWSNFSQKKLLRIFSEQEIIYAFNNSHINKKAERLAARFAAREAFYKALHQMAPGNTVPLLTLCKKIEVEYKKGMSPQLIVDWDALKQYIKNSQTLPRIKSHLSITHSKNSATAMVILEQ